MADFPVVLVTGSSRGIGRHLAEHYLERGYLVEGCSREASDLKRPGYVHHRLDVSQENAVRKMVADIRKRRGRLDAALNNAGIASMNHVLLTPVATIDHVMAVNFRGTFLVSRESAKVMRQRKFGRIVNFTSVAVPLRLEGEAAYAASKSAIASLTEILARELAGFGITCNAVGPPPIETDLIRGVPKGKIQRIVERLAIKRLGTLADVANAVDFFLKPESGYVTGQVLYLGGL